MGVYDTFIYSIIESRDEFQPPSEAIPYFCNKHFAAAISLFKKRNKEEEAHDKKESYILLHKRT